MTYDNKRHIKIRSNTYISLPHHIPSAQYDTRKLNVTLEEDAQYDTRILNLYNTLTSKQHKTKGHSMRLKHINQLKKCVRTFQNVNVFKFNMGDGDYYSVWSMPDKDYDPVDRMSQILFDLSIKGRSLTTCSVQDNWVLGRKTFVIGSSRTKDYSTNIDADLVDFFINQVKERQRREAIQQEMVKDIP